MLEIIEECSLVVVGVILITKRRTIGELINKWNQKVWGDRFTAENSILSQGNIFLGIIAILIGFASILESVS